MVKFIGRFIGKFNKAIKTNLTLSLRNLIFPRYLARGKIDTWYSFNNHEIVREQIDVGKILTGVAVPYTSDKVIFEKSDRIYLIDGFLFSSDCVAKSYIDCTKQIIDEIDNALNTAHKNIAPIFNKIISPFSIAIIDNDKVIIGRDHIGIKKIWTAYDGNNWHFGNSTHVPYYLRNIEYLPPATFGILTKSGISTMKYYVPDITEIETYDEKSLVNALTNLLTEAVKQRVLNKKIAVSFSGGLDSTLIAYLAKQYADDVTLVNTTFGDMKDRTNAITAAEKIGLEVNFVNLEKEELYEIVPRIIGICGQISKMSIEIAIPFFATARYLKDKSRHILMGQGADELFGGYKKYQDAVLQNNLEKANKLMLEDLRKLQDTDLSRDDNVMHAHGLNLILPYLDKKIVNFAVNVPIDFKINEIERKIILRHTAINIDFPIEIAIRSKLATQYGSGSHKALNYIIKHSNIRKAFDNFDDITKIILAIYKLKHYPVPDKINIKEIPFVREANKIVEEFENEWRKIKI